MGTVLEVISFFIVVHPLCQAIGVPWGATWLSKVETRWTVDGISWISRGPLSSSRACKNPISCTLLDILNAYLPISCGNYCNYIGDNSTLYRLGVKIPGLFKDPLPLYR